MSDVTPNEPVVQGPAPVEMRAHMENNLEKALGKLSALEMPKVGGAKAPLVQEQTSGGSAGGDGDVSAGVGGAGDTQPSRQKFVEPATPAPDPSLSAPPASPQAPIWGPQQARALQEVLSNNERMEKQLQELQAERDKYRGIVEDAQNGDFLSFAEKAKVSESEILDSLSAGGKAPVTRPYVRKLENTVQTLSSKLEQLEQQIQQREVAARQERELSDITQQLQVKGEYGILRKIPDAAQRIQALIRQREAAARDRGEVAPAISVDQAAAMLKGTLVESLKQLLADDSVKQELGLMGQATAPPDTVKPPKAPSKGITGKMTSQGSITRTTQGYSPDEQLRRALKKMLG